MLFKKGQKVVHTFGSTLKEILWRNTIVKSPNLVTLLLLLAWRGDFLPLTNLRFNLLLFAADPEFIKTQILIKGEKEVCLVDGDETKRYDVCKQISELNKILNDTLYTFFTTLISSHFKCFKMGQFLPLFCLFSFFNHHNSNIIWKSLDVVHGDRTRGRKMIGAAGSTALCLPSPTAK